MLRIAIVAAAALAVLRVLLRRRRQAQRAISGSGRCVVVSGASRGIGQDIAIRLAASGFRVYAGVRKPADGDALVAQGGSSIVPVALDVTDEKQAQAVADRVERDCAADGLRFAGVVCNAGLNYNQVVEAMDLKRMRAVFDVNTFGVLSTLQPLLPLLRAGGGGRVVLISSLAAFCSRPLNGAFAASKAALEMIADSLRRECLAAAKSGAPLITVSVVEPGRIRTPGLAGSLSDAGSIAEEMGSRLSGGPYAGLVKGRMAQQARASTGGVAAESCDAVSHAVEAALTEPQPRDRYWVGGFSGLPGWVLPLLAAIVPNSTLDGLVIQAVMKE